MFFDTQTNALQVKDVMKSRELYLMAFDSSGLTRLTTNDVIDGGPCVITRSSP